MTQTEESPSIDFNAPILQIGNEQAFVPEETIYLGVRYLAGACDGAKKQDGVGFNRMHSHFGHSLAELPFQRWTDKQLWAARQMLARYSRTQLAWMWHLVPEVPNPDEQPRRVYDRNNRPTLTQPGKVVRRMLLGEREGEPCVVLQHTYDTALVDAIKMLPGRHYNVEGKFWTLPLDYDTLEQVAAFSSEWGYQIDQQVYDKVDGILTLYGERLELSHAAEARLHIPGFGTDLLQPFPFQRAGILYVDKVISHDKGVLIADEMGLGKTVQALGIAKKRDLFPLIVICPASLKWTWKREAERWIPGIRARVLDGRVHSLMEGGLFGTGLIADIFIVNYNIRILEKWVNEFLLITPKSIILDEVHNLKNRSAKQTRKVEEFIELAEVPVIALSGTPFVNHPKDFLQIIRLLNHLDTVGGEDSFLMRYGSGNMAALKQLNREARMNFMVRRKKIDVLKELPPKMRQRVDVDIDNRQAYDEAERDVAHFFAIKKSESEVFERECAEEWSVNYSTLSEEFATFEQFFAVRKREKYGVAYEIAAQAEQLIRWEALKQVALAGKKAACFEWIDDFLEATSDKLIIFVAHTAFGQEIADRYGAPFIHGGVDPNKRMPLVDRFQDDAECRIIVGNLIAMGEGLTLTAATHVAFMELGWNPKQMGQAEDRAHRIGQQDTVNVYHVVAYGTIEDEVSDIIMRKQEQGDALQDGDPHQSQKEMFEELAGRIEAKLRRG